MRVINSDDFQDLSIEKRMCRFPHERWHANASLHYSFISCEIYMRVENEMKNCNCTLHFAPSECNFENWFQINDTNANDIWLWFIWFYRWKSLLQFSSNDMCCAIQHRIRKRKWILEVPSELYRNAYWYYRVTLLDYELLIVFFLYIFLFFLFLNSFSNIQFVYRHQSKARAIKYSPIDENDTIAGFSSVKIEIFNKQKRLIRAVSFDTLDLVVTVGSIAGVFFGASFLSLAEIIFIWILHKFKVMENHTGN